jgi:hypothetical protein
VSPGCDADTVPELTRNASIQLNERVLLRPRGEEIASSDRTLSHVRSIPSKAVGRSYCARRLCFDLLAFLERLMLRKFVRISLVSIGITVVGLPASAAAWVALALLGY